MKIQNSKFKIQNKGFTLVELLVSIGIFSVVIGVISGIFIFGIRQQKLALLNQVILDQASFSLEFMSRALRMAKKELSTPACLSQNGLNYEIPVGYRISGNEDLGTGLRFINHLENDDCQEFFLEQSQLKYRKKIGQLGEESLPLTSNKLEITSLKFNLVGKSQGDVFQPDDLQPRVTIFLELKGKGELESSQKIKIQTTISQRNLDVLR